MCNISILFRVNRLSLNLKKTIFIVFKPYQKRTNQDIQLLRYLHRQIFNILFCPQNLSTVSSDDVICISGVLF